MSFCYRVLPLVSAVFLAGCEPAPTPTGSGSTAPILTATETSQAFGDYTAYFNALATNQLTAEIASQYGIVRSQNRAMLNVSVLRRGTNGPDTAVRATIDVSVRNLSGQLKNITMRPVTEGDAIYYIGEVVVTNAETLIFSIDVTPDGEPEGHSIRYMKQFFVD